MPSKKFSVKWLDSLKSHEKQTDYFDSVQRGLGLRIGKSGKKTFFVIYRIKGDSKLYRLTFDLRYPDLSLSEEREKAREILVEADKGMNPNQEKKESRDAITFAELSKEYMKLHGNHKRSGHKDKQSIDRDPDRAR